MELHELPHNQLRKAGALKECIRRLEELQHRYKPIFDQDEAVNSLLQQMKAEHEAVMNVLQSSENAAELLENYFQEE